MPIFQHVEIIKLMEKWVTIVFTEGITKSSGGNPLNSSANAFPCGEIAYTYFTDTF